MIGGQPETRSHGSGPPLLPDASVEERLSADRTGAGVRPLCGAARQLEVACEGEWSVVEVIRPPTRGTSRSGMHCWHDDWMRRGPRAIQRRDDPRLHWRTPFKRLLR